MKAKLKFKGKEIEILDIKKCNLFWTVRGLMFTKREKARALLLFNFKKPRRMKIHSFFVFFPFITIWLDDKNRVIEFKVIKPWNPLVLPKKEFSRLLEIPLNNRYSPVVKFFLEKERFKYYLVDK